MAQHTPAPTTIRNNLSHVKIWHGRSIHRSHGSPQGKVSSGCLHEGQNIPVVREGSPPHAGHGWRACCPPQFLGRGHDTSSSANHVLCGPQTVRGVGTHYRSLRPLQTPHQGRYKEYNRITLKVKWAKNLQKVESESGHEHCDIQPSQPQEGGGHPGPITQDSLSHFIPLDTAYI